MRLRNMPRRALLGPLAAAALAMSALAVHAQDELVAVEPVHATMYVNGGIGQDEQQSMHEMAKDWPLRMVFSARKDNEYVADVRLLVTDNRGVPYLQLSGAGPLTYAKLPPGHYRIAASRHGQVETRDVTLDGKASREVVFHWQGAPKS